MDSSSGLHDGVLINEMDSVKELLDVTAVAATNRPDVIDSTAYYYTLVLQIFKLGKTFSSTP